MNTTALPRLIPLLVEEGVVESSRAGAVFKLSDLLFVQVHLFLEAAALHPDDPLRLALTMFKVPQALITHYELLLLVATTSHRLMHPDPIGEHGASEFL